MPREFDDWFEYEMIIKDNTLSYNVLTWWKKTKWGSNKKKLIYLLVKKQKNKKKKVPSLLSPDSPTHKNHGWPIKGKSQKRKHKIIHSQSATCRISLSAMIIIIRNLPWSSFPHCPIYTAPASPHTHQTQHQQQQHEGHFL